MKLLALTTRKPRSPIESLREQNAIVIIIIVAELGVAEKLVGEGASVTDKNSSSYRHRPLRHHPSSAVVTTAMLLGWLYTCYKCGHLVLCPGSICSREQIKKLRSWGID
jgi:hypothetical protein